MKYGDISNIIADRFVICSDCLLKYKKIFYIYTQIKPDLPALTYLLSSRNLFDYNLTILVNSKREKRILNKYLHDVCNMVLINNINDFDTFIKIERPIIIWTRNGNDRWGRTSEILKKFGDF